MLFIFSYVVFRKKLLKCIINKYKMLEISRMCIFKYIIKMIYESTF